MKKIFVTIIMFLLAYVLYLPSEKFVSAAGGDFKDVGIDYWAVKEVNYLQQFDIIRGYPEGTFKPNNSVTRAQAALMMTRALKLSTQNRPNPGFTDVSSSYFAYKEIAAVVDEGIIEKSSKFRPNEYLTREEMAKILVNGFNLKGSYNGEIRDVSSELKPFVSALAANGVTNIYDDHTFRPNQLIKRAHFSVFMARIMNASYRVDYSVLPLFFPDLKLNMSIDTTKNVMKSFTLDSEIELPFDNTDYQIIYLSDLTDIKGEELVILSFKDDKLHRVIIDIENYYDSKPTINSLDNKYEETVQFFKPYVGIPKISTEPFNPDSILFYEKEGNYSGSMLENCRVYVGGYDFTSEEGLDYDYNTSQMLIITE